MPRPPRHNWREQSKAPHIRHSDSVLFSYYAQGPDEIGAYPYFQMPLGVCKLFPVHAPLITAAGNVFRHRD